MKVKIRESVLKQIVEQETKNMLEEKNNRMANIVFAIGEAYAECPDKETKSRLEEVFSMLEKELFIDHTPYKLKELFVSKNGDLK